MNQCGHSLIYLILINLQLQEVQSGGVLQPPLLSRFVQSTSINRPMTPPASAHTLSYFDAEGNLYLFKHIVSRVFFLPYGFFRIVFPRILSMWLLSLFIPIVFVRQWNSKSIQQSFAFIGLKKKTKKKEENTRRTSTIHVCRINSQNNARKTC